MRVVPSSQHDEDDYSQKYWVFGPSFVRTPTETSADEEEDEVEEALDPPPPPPKPRPSVSGRKRPRETGKKSRKRAEGKRDKKKKSEEKGKSDGSTGGPAGPAPRAARGSVSSSERWTMERYERAELMVIEVMREKEAELGHRIARRDLREGARKHIGDTGLLDHLLKHMAGKVVGDRGERFMRGYSNDGVMQYWLEPAELEESRKKGELVEDCRCGAECKEEISLLREKIGTLNRDLEELRSLKELEKSVWKENYEKLLKRNIKLEAEMEEMNSSFQGLKENYERLLKRNVKLEYEMTGINSSFQGLKDEMVLLKEEKSKEEDEEKKALEEVETIGDVKGCNDNGVGDVKIENGVCDNGVSDKKSDNKQEHLLSTSPKTSFSALQLRKTYLQLPCRGRVYVNCLNGSQKSIGHLSQLPPLESEQLPSLSNPQCTRQRH